MLLPFVLTDTVSVEHEHRRHEKAYLPELLAVSIDIHPIFLHGVQGVICTLVLQQLAYNVSLLISQSAFLILTPEIFTYALAPPVSHPPLV